ncbi:MAG: zinc-dependent peptidase, partial [Bacteroidota bacterium]
MPAALLIMPVLLIAMILLWVVEDKMLVIYMLIPMAIYMVTIFIFRVRINLFFAEKFPPRLMRDMIDVLDRYFPFYHRLNPTEKKRFQKRVAMFDIPKEFVAKELPAVPEDIKTLIMAHAIMITFGKKEFVLPEWIMIVVYKNPFISEQITEWHAAEWHQEDGVLMLSADVMVSGLTKSRTTFNFATYLMAQAYALSEGIDNSDYLVVPNAEGDQAAHYIQLLAQIRNWPKGPESFYKKFSEEDLFGLTVEHFFYHPKKFKEILPETYDNLVRLLNLDPIHAEDPVVNFEVLEA